jgi:kynurenine formamidase
MLDSLNLIDLSHTLSENSPTWNGSCGFKSEIKLDYDKGLRVQKFHLHAGVSTHMDAPAHFYKDGKCCHELDIKDCIVPLYVIKLPITTLSSFVTLAHVEPYIEEHGSPIPGSFIAFETGWGEKFSDPNNYRADLKFPGIEAIAVEYLLQFEIAGIGIDTLSPDGSDMTFPIHHMILGRGKFILENLANLNLLPVTGSYLIALPLKIENATECPVRAVAFY